MPTPEPPQIDELLAEALARLPDRRDSYLRQACGSDVRLLGELQTLLRLHERAESFLERPAAGVLDWKAAIPLRGREVDDVSAPVGPYRPVERLGTGGFGEVWAAEQTAPVRRTVALKIIKLGMDTKQVIARFEAERQALALMDHPNIARVLDAGATDTGRPYFVMELVDGAPITKFCDQQRLTIRQRLELFIEVCQAVQHAHTKGVIHRDLKPSNVLVAMQDGKPTPKVIDFGIAKATNEPLTDGTLLTEARQLLGTPEYMSPEQAELGAIDIDTRSDVYSLGVLLYELLTGCTPFDRRQLRESSLDELRRIIREVEPTAPSARLTSFTGRRMWPRPRGRATSDTVAADDDDSGAARLPTDLPGNRARPSLPVEVAASRGVDPSELQRMLRGDLDWIVMQCLDKELSRRYETASALAWDLRRHLAGEPVVAAPPSRIYRLRKFGSRYRGAVVAGLAIVLVLVLGTVGTSAGLILALHEAGRAREAEVRAEDRADELEQVVAFLESQLGQMFVRGRVLGPAIKQEIRARREQALRLQGLTEQEIQLGLEDLDASHAGINWTGVGVASLREHILEPSLKTIDERLDEQPLVQARLLQIVGVTLPYALGEAPLARALKLRRRELGEAHPDTLYTALRLARIRTYMNRYDEGETMMRRVLEVAEREPGECGGIVLQGKLHLGRNLELRGRFDEAMQFYSEALAAAADGVASYEIDLGELAYLEAHLRYAISETLELADAEPLLREALHEKERLLGHGDLGTAEAMIWLGNNLRRQGRLSEAEPYLETALGILRRDIGDDEFHTLCTIHDLSVLYSDMGRYEEAKQLAEEVVTKGTAAVLRGGEVWAGARPQGPVMWRLQLARTLTALGDLGPAHEELLEVQTMTEDNTVPIRSTRDFKRFERDLADSFVRLYEAWHDAEPGSGYDTEAALWTERLEASQQAITPISDHELPGSDGE